MSSFEIEHVKLADTINIVCIQLRHISLSVFLIRDVFAFPHSSRIMYYTDGHGVG